MVSLARPRPRRAGRRRGRVDHPRRHARARRGRGAPGPTSRSSARDWGHAGGGERAGVDETGERAAHLRRWPNPARTRARAVRGRRAAGSGGARCGPAPTRRWGGQEHVGAHLGHDLGLGPVRHLHRRDAVGLAPGGGEAGRALHHHEHALDGGQPVEQVGHQRRGDARAGWPRVTTDRGRRAARASPPAGVAFHDADGRRRAPPAGWARGAGRARWR